MKAIGGYFGLADYEEGGTFPHQGGILLNTGRNALEYILRSIGEVKHLYLPYYTCEVVLEPVEKLGIPYTFYHTNLQLEIEGDIEPQQGEYIIANNYYGIKDGYIQQLAKRYGSQLIVDCAQAFFAKPIPGIKCFYSTRKYVGVADGGVAFLSVSPDGLVDVNGTDHSAEHDSHLLKRKQFGAEAGFSDFQANETKLDNQPIRWMSDDTKRILNHIDYDKVVALRRENFQYLHHALACCNRLKLPSMNSFECPMVYPFMTGKDSGLRKKLIENKVFVAKYWPNVVLKESFELENELANCVIPLPSDQRYGTEEMDRIIEIVRGEA